MRPTFLLFTALIAASGADWPRYGGPHGDFHVTAEESAIEWPAKDPRVLWSRPLGEGYSPVVVEGAALYTMYRRGEDEVVVSIDAKTGKTVWEQAYPAPIPAAFDVNYGTGPRASPLIAGGRLFTVGAAGKIHCLDKLTGKVLWKRDLAADFGGQIRNSGYSASPVIWGDTVIVLPWAPDAAIAALKISDGSVVWKKHSFVVSYATPEILRIGGREQLVAQFSDEVTGLDPATGDLLWSFPHTNNQKVNVAPAIWREDLGLMFLSCAYDGGGRVLRLTQEGGKTKAGEVWAHRMVRIHHSNAILIGDTILAPSGDFGPVPVAAVDLPTGKVLWRDRTFPKPSLVAAGAKVLVLDEDGNLALTKPGEKGLEVLGKMRVLANPAWTPPVLSGKTVYVRDRKTIAAVAFD